MRHETKVKYVLYILQYLCVEHLGVKALYIYFALYFSLKMLRWDRLDVPGSSKCLLLQLSKDALNMFKSTLNLLTLKTHSLKNIGITYTVYHFECSYN